VPVSLTLYDTDGSIYELLAKGIMTVPLLGSVFGDIGFRYELQTLHVDLSAPIPEPSTWVLVATGLIGILLRVHLHARNRLHDSVNRAH
jgi:hypothetical protein